MKQKIKTNYLELKTIIKEYLLTTILLILILSLMLFIWKFIGL